MRGRSYFMLVWPLTIFALSALAVLVLSLVVGAQQVDQSVRAHEERMVRRGLDAQIEGDENAFAGQTTGDAAMANLAERFNPDWARANLPLYLRQSIGIWDYLVVNPADQPVWASWDATPMGAQDTARFAVQATPLLNEIRKRERARAALLNAGTGANSEELEPLVLTGFEQRNGQAYMWMASVVQPGGPDGHRWKTRSVVVVAGGFITQADLDKVMARFALKGLRNELSPNQIRPYEAHTAFNRPWGGEAIQMVWTPQRPGHDLLANSVWIIGGVIVGFAGLAAVMVGMTRNAAKDLLAIDRFRAEFLANMSHEIRTPLNGVNALAELLSRSPLTPRQKQMADTIHRSGMLLLKLLTDILDLARIDAHGMELAREPFNLRGTARSVLDLMAAHAAEQGVELRQDLDPATDVEVIGDSTRFTQILINLMSNAIKFTEEGHVQLRVRPDPGDKDGSGVWRIEVKDTGIGFGPEVKARLFQRFQQGDGSVTRRFGGAGLGLAISRELAVKMGGSLDGEGEPGRGAVFTLIVPFPLSRAGEWPTAPPSKRPAPRHVRDLGRPLRILACEDDPMNRMVIGILLAELGAEFQFADDGQEACDAFETQTFDCILMDMQMPVMDGLSAIRWIRERERERQLARTPIIMLTANALPEHRSAGLAAGADRFLVKPLEADDLSDALSGLNRPSAASQA